jgi:hypothetical protein
MSGIAGVRGQRIYGQHGERHAPRGSDPSRTDAWRNVLTAGTAWASGTTYAAGDIVDDAAHVFQYQAASGSVNAVANHGIQPGVTSGWWSYWNYYASIFQNGSNMAPTMDIPNPVPLRYRLSVGPPNIIDEGAIVLYTQHQVEIQGDVTGLAPLDIVFTLLPEYTHDYDVPYHTHDDSGIFVPCRLLSTGEFIWDTA